MSVTVEMVWKGPELERCGKLMKVGDRFFAPEHEVEHLKKAKLAELAGQTKTKAAPVAKEVDDA